MKTIRVPPLLNIRRGIVPPPGCVQPKLAINSRRHQTGQAPPAYRPIAASIAAPPVYRPVARIQPKTAPDTVGHLTGQAPPVYRPIAASIAAPPVHRPATGIQAKTAPGTVGHSTGQAPPVYRPIAASIAAPPVYRPATGIQAKTAPILPGRQPLLVGQARVAHVIQRASSEKQSPVDEFHEYIRHTARTGASKAVRHRLIYADMAIQKAKRKIPYAGNIIQHVDKTGGASFGLTDLAREEASEVTLFLREQIYGKDPMVRSAVAARRVGGGNCGEHANVVYFELLRMNIGERTSRCHMTDEVDHAFVLIGDPADEDTLVVADAWADVPQAVRYKDWTFCPATYGVDRREISIGQNPLSAVRKATKDRKEKIAKKKAEIERRAKKKGPAAFGLNLEKLPKGFYEAPTTVTARAREDVFWSGYVPTEEELAARARMEAIFSSTGSRSSPRPLPPPPASFRLPSLEEIESGAYLSPASASPLPDLSHLNLPEIDPRGFSGVAPPPPPPPRASSPDLPLDVSRLNLPEIDPRGFASFRRPPPPPPTGY
jgi:hypothetical protein